MKELGPVWVQVAILLTIILLLAIAPDLMIDEP